MKKENILLPENYTKNGEEKTFWHRVGEIREVNGKKFMKLYMFPEKKLMVMPEKPKPQQNTQTADQYTDMYNNL